eukprot:1417092-Rhodomonas_salina.1
MPGDSESESGDHHRVSNHGMLLADATRATCALQRRRGTSRPRRSWRASCCRAAQCLSPPRPRASSARGLRSAHARVTPRHVTTLMTRISDASGCALAHPSRITPLLSHTQCDDDDAMLTSDTSPLSHATPESASDITIIAHCS